MVDRIGPSKPFRHFIREWMDKRGLNQAQIAGRLEIETGTVSKLINGHMRMSDKWLAGFAWVLNVEVGDLFRDPNTPTQQELLDGLTDDQRETVINLINMLRKAG